MSDETEILKFSEDREMGMMDDGFTHSAWILISECVKR